MAGYRIILHVTAGKQATLTPKGWRAWDAEMTKVFNEVWGPDSVEPVPGVYDPDPMMTIAREAASALQAVITVEGEPPRPRQPDVVY